jgi:hypothetical protein
MALNALTRIAMHPLALRNTCSTHMPTFILGLALIIARFRDVFVAWEERASRERKRC